MDYQTQWIVGQLMNLHGRMSALEAHHVSRHHRLNRMDARMQLKSKPTGILISWSNMLKLAAAAVSCVGAALFEPSWLRLASILAGMAGL